MVDPEVNEEVMDDDDWDDEVADSIAIGEIHPRVATVGEQVQVMGSQTGKIVSRLKENETRVQQILVLGTWKANVVSFGN
nr:hypothetical protein [Tanacetum cinerariifolium]